MWDQFFFLAFRSLKMKRSRTSHAGPEPSVEGEIRLITSFSLSFELAKLTD